MGRRKQAQPKRCPVSEDNDGEPSTKYNKQQIHTSQPSSSGISNIGEISKQTTNAKPQQTANPLALLEKSLKKFEPSGKTSSRQQAPQVSVLMSNATGLSALFNIVGKLDPSTLLSSSRKEEGVSSILKCLQCGKSFPAMEQLVKHMQETKHFDNLPKTYSSMLQLDRQKVLNIKLQTKSDGRKLACVKCGEIPVNMDKHLREIHDVRSYSDWLNSVKLIESDAKTTKEKPISSVSPHLNSLMTLINTVDKQ